MVGKSGVLVLRFALALVLAANLLALIAQAQQTSPTLKLASSSFSGDEILSKYTCGAEGRAGIDKAVSPELSWSAPPEHTLSFALLADDKDSTLHSLLGYFVHWVLYNLPADKRELPEALPKQEQLPDGSRQGLNGFDKIGYVGPCPPGKSPHHYSFVLYALDSKLDLPANATEKQVVKAMNGHILTKGELVGRYPY